MPPLASRKGRFLNAVRAETSILVSGLARANGGQITAPTQKAYETLAVLCDQIDLLVPGAFFLSFFFLFFLLGRTSKAMAVQR